MKWYLTLVACTLLNFASFKQINTQPTLTISTSSSSTPCYGDVVTLVCHHPELATNKTKYFSSPTAWRQDDMGITPSTGVYGQADTSEDFMSTTLTINITVDHFRNKSFYYSCILLLAGTNGLPSGDVETSGRVTIDPLEFPHTPFVTNIASKDISIDLKWSHDSVCFEGSTFHYIVTWESAGGGGPSREVHTATRNITMVASTRQTFIVRIRAVGNDGMAEHQSKEVYLQITAGLPAVYGLSDEPCFGRSYVLVCEHDYSGQRIWSVGEDKQPITENNTRYTISSSTLEIHNTSDVVSEESEVYYCSVKLTTGTTVTGSAHDLRPLNHPLKPDSLSVTSDSYSGTVAWKQSSWCFEEFKLSHKIQWKKESETEWSSSVLPSSTTQHTISGLTAATLYDVRLRVLATDVQSSTILFSHFSTSSILTLSEPLAISFGVVGSFLLFISTIMLTVLVMSCLWTKCCALMKCRNQELQDGLTASDKDHHHHHISPDRGRSTPANTSTESDDLERIANPSYQPFEMCHEKATYSNL